MRSAPLTPSLRARSRLVSPSDNASRTRARSSLFDFGGRFGFGCFLFCRFLVRFGFGWFLGRGRLLLRRRLLFLLAAALGRARRDQLDRRSKRDLVRIAFAGD